MAKKEKEVHVARKHFCLQVCHSFLCRSLLFSVKVSQRIELVTRSIAKCQETDENVIDELQITIGSEKLLVKLD